MIAGGGTPFTFDFSGTGNWQVNNYLVTIDTPNNNTGIQVDGPGALIWSPVINAPGVLNSLSFVNITGGSLIMTTNHPQLNSQPFTINGTFQFAPSPPATQSLSGPISGTGVFQVSAGKVSLSGASSFSGTNLLSGGQLIAKGSENPGASGPLGRSNTITFAGGTLGFSTNNSFDYSPRFDTAPGQQYNIDTAGQTVTFANSLTSSGGTLTKLGAGRLILAGLNSYDGPTAVAAGKLVIQGSAGPGSIDVANGAALGIFENGSPITTVTLSMGTGTILEFNNVTNTTTAALTASTLSTTGTTTININSGALAAGQSYPLVAWTNGPVPVFQLGSLNGGNGNLSVSNNVLYLNAPPALGFTNSANGLQLSWTGNFKLQVQTNDLGGTNWVDYPGSLTSPVTITVDPANTSVFFRLLSIP
jgi:autotransporter-associated beta strand protein